MTSFRIFYLSNLCSLFSSLLEEGPEFTARMACHKMPEVNIVVFGCDQKSKELYEWDLDTDVITKSDHKCPQKEGISIVSNFVR